MKSLLIVLLIFIKSGKSNIHHQNAQHGIIALLGETCFDGLQGLDDPNFRTFRNWSRKPSLKVVDVKVENKTTRIIYAKAENTTWRKNIALYSKMTSILRPEVDVKVYSNNNGNTVFALPKVVESIPCESTSPTKLSLHASRDMTQNWIQIAQIKPALTPDVENTLKRILSNYVRDLNMSLKDFLRSSHQQRTTLAKLNYTINEDFGGQEAEQILLMISKSSQNSSSLSSARSLLRSFNSINDLLLKSHFNQVKDALVAFVRDLEENFATAVVIENARALAPPLEVKATPPIVFVERDTDSLVVIGDEIDISDFANRLNTCSNRFNHIFASQTIFISQNISLPGCSISIVSPRVHFNGSSTISLTGVSGGQFPDLRCQFANTRPGRVGGTAGNIVFIAGVVSDDGNRTRIVSTGGLGGAALGRKPVRQYVAPGKGGLPGLVLVEVEEGNVQFLQLLGETGQCHSENYIFDFRNPGNILINRTRPVLSCHKPPEFPNPPNEFREDEFLLQNDWCDPLERPTQPPQDSLQNHLRKYINLMIGNLTTKSMRAGLWKMLSPEKLRHLSNLEIAGLVVHYENFDDHMDNTTLIFMEHMSNNIKETLRGRTARVSNNTVFCDLAQNHCNINFDGKNISQKDCLNGGMFWFPDVQGCSINPLRYRNPFFDWCDQPNAFEYIDWDIRRGDDVFGRPESCHTLRGKNISILNEADIRIRPDSNGENFDALAYARSFINPFSSVFLNQPAFVYGGSPCYTSHIFSKAIRMRPGGPLYQNCENNPWMQDCVKNLNVPRLSSIPFTCSSQNQQQVLQLSRAERIILYSVLSYIALRHGVEKRHQDHQIFTCNLKAELEFRKTTIEKFISLEDEPETNGFAEIRKRLKSRRETLQNAAKDRKQSIEEAVEFSTKLISQHVSTRVNDVVPKLELLINETLRLVAENASGLLETVIASNQLTVLNAIKKFAPGHLNVSLPFASIVGDLYGFQFAKDWSTTGSSTNASLTQMLAALSNKIEIVRLSFNLSNEKQEKLLDDIVGKLQASASRAPDTGIKQELLRSIANRNAERTKATQDWETLRNTANKIVDNALKTIEVCGGPSGKEMLRIVKTIQLITRKEFDFDFTQNFPGVLNMSDELTEHNHPQDSTVSSVQIDFIRTYLKGFSEVTQLLNMSTASIDIHRLRDKMVSGLQSMRVDIEGIYSWFQHEENSDHHFRAVFDNAGATLEKLEDALNTFQLFEEEARLAEFTLQLERLLDLGDIPEGAIKETYLILQRMLRKEDIRYHYQRAEKTFHQLAFPFAKPHSRTLEDLTVLQFSDSNKFFGKKAIANIDQMLLKSKSINTIISPEIDGHIKRRHFEVIGPNENASDKGVFPPFFSWDGDYHPEILELISGKEVFLKADILGAGFADLHGLKFDWVDIVFHIDDESEEHSCDFNTTQIAEDLGKYSMQMDHMGTSSYRWGNDFYKIQTPIFKLNFTFQTASVENGIRIPTERSETYNQMTKGEIALSPFAIWRLQLIPLDPANGFSRLEMYKDCDITMALVGSGSYAQPDLSFNVDIGLDVKNLYLSDTTLNSLELARQSVGKLNITAEDATVFQQLTEMIEKEGFGRSGGLTRSLLKRINHERLVLKAMAI